MKRATDSSHPANAVNAAAAPKRVSLRAMYSDALREVMADPRKAVAEHDPWLAALLPPTAKTAKG